MGHLPFPSSDANMLRRQAPDGDPGGSGAGGTDRGEACPYGALRERNCASGAITWFSGPSSAASGSTWE